MGLNLKEYTDETEYVNTYNHNYAQIDGIEKDSLFDGFVKSLARISGIDRELVLLDLKRYLMHNYEYNPVHLKKKWSNIFLPLVYVFYLLLNVSPKREKPALVLIDYWQPTLRETLYGEELVSRLEKNHGALYFSVKGYKKVRLTHLIRSFPCMFRSFISAGKIAREHGVDLTRYVGFFYSNCLSGWALKEDLSPRLIISANDNGFPLVKGKAAGASIMLIQNGGRCYMSDSTYAYADHYISMGGKKLNSERLKMGCLFRNVHYYGSIRLYNYLKSRGTIKKEKPLYDVLFIEGFDLENYAKMIETFYSRENEVEVIKMINGLAAKGDMKVAYQFKGDKNIENIKALGLFSDNITYITKKKKSVYETILESAVILSTFSTASLEAMAFPEKKIGFINLSSNAYTVYEYGDLNIEYRRGSMSLADFVADLRGRKIDYSDYLVQNPGYVEDIVILTGKILEKPSNPSLSD
jgi:hypothetical protein